MSQYLHVGMVIFHRNSVTKAITEATIVGMEEEKGNITIKLKRKVADKSMISLPITHFGEWLFFSEDHASLTPEQLLDLPEYIGYRNKQLLILKEEIAMEKRIEEEKKEKSREAKERLLKHLKKGYDFEGFHHYTDMTNFIKIMQKNKLYSREKADEEGFNDAADQDVIGITDESVKNHVRFFYKEKTPTLYKNEGIKESNSDPHMPLPVLLLFDENIIFHPYSVFANGGGGSSKTTFTMDADVAIKYNWESIFSRGELEEGPRKREIINNRNAEFLYPTEIETSHLKKILFRAPADMKQAMSVLGKNGLFEIDKTGDKFNCQHNFLYDYNIEIQNKEILIVLSFYRDIVESYTHKVKIFYMDDTEIIDVDNMNRFKLNLNSKYGFTIKPSRIADIIGIEYMLNGHVSAIWRSIIND